MRVRLDVEELLTASILPTLSTTLLEDDTVMNNFYMRLPPDSGTTEVIESLQLRLTLKLNEFDRQIEPAIGLGLRPCRLPHHEVSQFARRFLLAEPYFDIDNREFREFTATCVRLTDSFVTSAERVSEYSRFDWAFMVGFASFALVPSLFFRNEVMTACNLVSDLVVSTRHHRLSDTIEDQKLAPLDYKLFWSLSLSGLFCREMTSRRFEDC